MPAHTECLPGDSHLLRSVWTANGRTGHPKKAGVEADFRSETDSGSPPATVVGALTLWTRTTLDPIVWALLRRAQKIVLVGLVLSEALYGSSCIVVGSLPRTRPSHHGPCHDKPDLGPMRHAAHEQRAWGTRACRGRAIPSPRSVARSVHAGRACRYMVVSLPGVHESALTGV